MRKKNPIKRDGIVLMAIAAGQESKESIPSKVHVGVAACTLLAVNPNKNELSTKIFGTPERPANIEKEPEYIMVDDKEIKTIRIEFFLKVITEDENAPAIIKRISYFVRNEKYFNKDNTKVQVINAYGDTAWLTKEELTAKQAPAYAPDYVLKGMRVALKGEEDLVRFIKKFMNIPNYAIMKPSGEREVNPNPANCECQLGAIDKYFSGNITEIKEALSLRKTNKIKLLFGAKVTEDNKVYQDTYSRFPMSYGLRSYESLKRHLEKTIEGGGYANTYFGEFPYEFKEYTIRPSNLQQSVTQAEWGAPAPIQQTNESMSSDWGAGPADDDLPFNN